MSDKELIKGCIEQDQKSQRMLYEKYSGKFMAVCLRYANDAMEAEDMLLEGFMRIFSHAHQFKFEGAFEGWMRRIIVNVCLKNLQKKKLKFSDTEIESHNEPSIPALVSNNLGAEALMKLIAGLPEGYRIVFNLNVIEGYSHEEIAVLLGIQPSTSRSQLVKARKMLQNKIAQLEKIAV